MIASEQSGGNPTIVEYQIGSGWLIAFGQPLEISYDYGWDAGTILFNTLLWGNEYVPVGGDLVTWMWEEPVSGTVTAGSVLDVGIYLTSLYTDGTPMPLGDYFAVLTVKSDSPVEPKKTLPVTMHIVSEYLAPVPEFEASTEIVGTPTELLNTSDGGIPPAKEYEWDFGDGTTLIVGNMDPVYHLYGTYGTFTVTLTACNVMGCETVEHDVVVLPKVILLPFVSKN